MLISHIEWLQDRKLSQHVNEWCDLLISFLETLPNKQVDILTSVRLVKVGVLMSSRDYRAALSTACKALYSVHNLRTVVAVFRALLHYEDIAKSSIVQHFVNHLQQSAKQSAYKIGDEDFLHELSVCCSVVEQSPSLHISHRNLIIEQLLHAWINLYHSKRLWKGAVEDPIVHRQSADKQKDEADCDFFEAALLYCSYTMKTALVGRYNKYGGEKVDGEGKESGSRSHGSESPLISSKPPVDENPMGIASPIVPTNDSDDAMQFCSVLIEQGADVDLVVVMKVLHVMRLVHEVLGEIKSCGRNDDWEAIQSILGSADQLLYLANLCALLAEALVQNKQASFMQQVRETSPERLSLSLKSLDMAATLFHLASSLYASLPNANRTEYLRRHMTCLLQCCAAYMDAYQVQLYCSEADISLPRRNEDGSVMESEEPQAVDANQHDRVEQCRRSAEALEQLLLKMAEFADEEDIKMLGIMLLLHFSSYCLYGSNAECEKFIERKKGVFMRASSSVLNDCVMIASSSHVCSTDTLRQLITCTLQACLGHSMVSYRTVGSFYRRLIELSPSRKYAMSKIEEFEQILREVMSKKNKNEEDGFDQFDIDQIFTLTYNYGITLLDLDQVSLAEQFMQKASKLLQYTSTEMHQWEQKVKVSVVCSILYIFIAYANVSLDSSTNIGRTRAPAYSQVLIHKPKSIAKRGSNRREYGGKETHC